MTFWQEIITLAHLIHRVCEICHTNFPLYLNIGYADNPKISIINVVREVLDLR